MIHSFYHFPKVVRAVIANPTRTIFDLFIYGFSDWLKCSIVFGVLLKGFLSLDSDRLDSDKFKFFVIWSFFSIHQAKNEDEDFEL